MPLRSRLPLRNSVARTESPAEASTAPSSQPSRSASATGEGSEERGDHQREDDGRKSKNPTSWHWSEEQEMYFLERLLEARRQGKLKVKKGSTYKLLFKTFVPGFQRRWPEAQWAPKMMTMKITQIRSFWRAFKDMEHYSGSHYEHESGLLLMSEDNENLCLERYGPLGSKIATEGLPISDNINFEEYDEIFSDDKPAGKQIRPPGDRTYWQGRTRGRATQIGAVEAEVEEAAAAHDAIEEEAADEVEAEERAAPRDDCIFLSSSQDTQDSQQSLPASRDHSREAGNSPGRRLTASSPPQTRQRAQNRSTSRPVSDIPPNNPSVDRRRKRKRDEDRDGVPWGEMKEILMHQETRRTHNVVSCARPVGSQDIEKAIANCEEVMKEKELSLMIRVICWFQEDPGNAVVWNALGSIAAKEAWITRKIGPAAEPRE